MRPRVVSITVGSIESNPVVDVRASYSGYYAIRRDGDLLGMCKNVNSLLTAPFIRFHLDIAWGINEDFM